jgi:uncharacterized membrane protein YhaH (DUF805 family)
VKFCGNCGTAVVDAASNATANTTYVVAPSVKGMGWYMLAWKKWFQVSGRASRREYWTFVLVNLVVIVCVAVATMALFAFADSDLDSRVLAIRVSAGLCAVIIFITTLTCQIRRLHDIGKSGWWILINFVPYVGGFVLLIFTLLDSNPGPNEYGENPTLIAR